MTIVNLAALLFIGLVAIGIVRIISNFIAADFQESARASSYARAIKNELSELILPMQELEQRQREERFRHPNSSFYRHLIMLREQFEKDPESFRKNRSGRPDMYAALVKAKRHGLLQ